MMKLAAAVGLLAALPATAAVIPAHVDGAAGRDASTIVFLKTFGSASNSNGDFVRATIDPGTPIVEASGSAIDLSARVNLHFYGQLMGPATDADGNPVLVPIIVAGSVATFSSTGHEALAFVDLAQGANRARISTCSGTNACGEGYGLHSVTGSRTLLVDPSGHQFAVWMFAGVGDEGTLVTQPPATRNYATAYQPSVYVDPAFPNASLYSIQFSEGINASPVPEPSTFAMLAAALGAAAVARRRVRARVR